METNNHSNHVGCKWKIGGQLGAKCLTQTSDETTKINDTQKGVANGSVMAGAIAQWKDLVTSNRSHRAINEVQSVEGSKNESEHNNQPNRKHDGNA